MNLHKVPNEQEVADLLGVMLLEKSTQAITANGVFRIGVSGSSIIPILAVALLQIEDETITKFKFFFCDERFVPLTDRQSTFAAYKAVLLPRIPADEEQFVHVNTNLSLKECAQDYEEKILKEFDMKTGDIPQFDFLVLGMGDDGHTCSLFPHHPLLKEKNHLIAAISDSPKPPPERVTMTFPLLNNAKYCTFIVCGENKAEIIKRVLKDKEDLPANMVKPLNNEIHWLIDEDAGKLL